MSLTARSVSVIGLGKLGSPIAAALAAHGLKVIGADTDANRVAAIRRGEAPVFEPGLAEMLQRARPNLEATNDVAAAAQATDVSLLIVPTPSDRDGGFSLRHLLPACRSIGQALRGRRERHTVVVTSTVMPGATAGPIRQALEQASGRAAGADFGLCYSPEFVALGSVIHDFLHPDFLLVGCDDHASGDHLEALYRALHGKNIPPVARMSTVNAELAKLAVNTFVTTRITFANTLAGICQNLPGADVDVVTNAIGLDSRIGRKYLKGGVSFGGPCFPRDNAALTALARRVGASAELPATVDRVNADMIDQLAHLVREHVPRGGAAAVLGLSYKPETDVVDRSPGILLARELASMAVPTFAFDPAANHNARPLLPTTVTLTETLRDALEPADVLVVVTPWREFVALDAAALAVGERAQARVIVDCWRCINPESLGDAARVVAVGRAPADLAPLESASLRVA